jgi:hypothetical protein
VPQLAGLFNRLLRGLIGGVQAEVPRASYTSCSPSPNSNNRALELEENVKRLKQECKGVKYVPAAPATE